LSDAWQAIDCGILVHVRVTPKASRDEIIGVRTSSDGRRHLAVKVSAPPQDGAANDALRMLIAKQAGLSRSAVALVKGEQAPEKKLVLSGERERLMAWLDSFEAC
jgi:uncharacterized protein (TIGR00251 family)